MNTIAPVLLVMAGPAGSGKSTLCDRLPVERPEFSRVVTTTTRAPRNGEINGVHYHFFSPQEFRSHIERGEFLEWSLVHGGHEDRLYGTLRSSVLEPLHHGHSLIMNVDVQGVETFRRAAREDPLIGRAFSTVFIHVDRDRLIRRIRDRGTDHDGEIAIRMQTAELEMLEASKFDFIIESRTREEDFAALLEIVDEAKRISARRAAA